MEIYGGVENFLGKAGCPLLAEVPTIGFSETHEGSRIVDIGDPKGAVGTKK